MTGDRESSECSCSSIGSGLGIEENARRELRGIALHENLVARGRMCIARAEFLRAL